MKRIFTLVSIMLLGSGALLAQNMGLSRTSEPIDLRYESDFNFNNKSADCATDYITFPNGRASDGNFYAYGTDRGTAQVFPHSASASVTGVLFIGASEDGAASGVAETDIEFEAYVYSIDANGDLEDTLYSQTIFVDDDLTTFNYFATFDEAVDVEGFYGIGVVNRDTRSVLLGNSADGDALGDDLSWEFTKLDPDDADEVPNWYKLSDLYGEDVDNFIFSEVEQTIVADYTYTGDLIVDSVLTFSNSSIVDTLGYHNLSNTIFTWDFGDGNTSTDTNPTHTYANCGVFPVELTVTYEANDGTICEDIYSEDIEINSSDSVIVATTNTTACGDADGQIEVSLLNSSEEFEFTVDGTTYNSVGSVATVTGLTADNYDFTVILDGTGCEFDETASINDGGTPEIALASTGVSCSGKTDAWITVVPQGADTDTVDYEFTWNTGDVADSIEVGAGSYSVTGNDGTCTITANISVADGNLLDIELSETASVSCAGEEDAELSVTSPDGVDISGYTFIWSDNDGVIAGEEDEALTNVGSGNYEVEGGTGNECNTTLESIEVTAPDAVTLDLDSVSYVDTDNANINISVGGGTGALSTDWTGPNGFTSTDEDISVTENGTYTVTVTDDNGCEVSASYEVDVLSIANLSANNINVYPNPASTAINFDVEGADAKSIYVYDATGKAIASIDVNADLVEFDVESLSNGLYYYHITKQDGSILGSSKFTVAK